MSRADNSILYQKSFKFSLKVIEFYKDLVFNKKEFVISKQVLRSSTSIGANLSEASESQSIKEFISKLYICLKEARETEYWIKLLIEAKYIDEMIGKSLLKDLSEIIIMLISSIKKSKQKLN